MRRRRVQPTRHCAGEHDAAGVIAKWEQRGANMGVWQVCGLLILQPLLTLNLQTLVQGLAEETEAHWERLLKEKETLTKQVQQKFAFASSMMIAQPNESPSASPGMPVPDLQALAESHIKTVSDALNKR
jgi:hypothetical protein